MCPDNPPYKTLGVKVLTSRHSMERLIGFIHHAIHSVLARRAGRRSTPALVYQSEETFFDESEEAWATRFPVRMSYLHTGSSLTVLIKVAAPYEFWWTTTGEPLARMLEWASYPLPLRSSYLSFYHRCILPEFGPFNLVSEEPFSSSSPLSAPQKSVCTFLLR